MNDIVEQFGILNLGYVGTGKPISATTVTSVTHL